jgi:hypothetical protein
MEKPKTTYSFDEYVQLCCTVSSFNELEVLTELLEKEALCFTEEEALYLCDLADYRVEVLMQMNLN